MSKKSRELTVADFEAMTEEQRLELDAYTLARLTAEKQKADQDKADEEESVAMKVKYAKQAPDGLFCLRVGDAKAWLKKMDRKLVSMIAMTAGQDPVEAAELVLENCWLEGDERIKTDDEYFFGAMKELKQLRASKLAEIKKY